MSSTQIVLIVILIILVLLLAVGGWMLQRRRALRARFGPEYDRAVSEQDSRRAAEKELRERERLHAELELRPLSEESRRRYVAAWQEIQSRFVDTPVEAVAAADKLITQLAADRGYPTRDYDEQAALLSVEHSRTLGHYREAHEISVLNERGQATTEQLRQAVVHYRALFADMLGEEPVQETGGAAGAPADRRAPEAEPERAGREATPAEADRRAERGEPDWRAERAERAEADRRAAEADPDRVDADWREHPAEADRGDVAAEADRSRAAGAPRSEADWRRADTGGRRSEDPERPWTSPPRHAADRPED